MIHKNKTVRRRKRVSWRNLWLKQHDSADDVVADIANNSATMDKPLIPKRAK